MGSNPVQNTTTLRAVRPARIVAEWVEWLERRNLADNTVYTYRRIAANVLESVDLHSVTLDELEDWCHRTRRTGKPGANAAVKRDMDVCRSLFGFAHDRGLIDQNPASQLISPKRNQKSPEVVDPEVFRRTFESAPEREQVLLLLMRYGGLRRAEAAQIRWRHLDSFREDGTLRNLVRKGGDEATVPLADCFEIYKVKRPDLLIGGKGELHRFLHAWIGVHTGGSNQYVFPKSANGSVDWVNKRTKILSGGAFTPHALRHTFGTDLARMGTPIHVLKSLMNHSDVQTTMRYIHTEKADVTSWL